MNTPLATLNPGAPTVGGYGLTQPGEINESPQRYQQLADQGPQDDNSGLNGAVRLQNLRGRSNGAPQGALSEGIPHFEDTRTAELANERGPAFFLGQDALSYSGASSSFDAGSIGDKEGLQTHRVISVKGPNVASNHKDWQLRLKSKVETYRGVLGIVILAAMLYSPRHSSEQGITLALLFTGVGTILTVLFFVGSGFVFERLALARNVARFSHSVAAFSIGAQVGFDAYRSTGYPVFSAPLAILTVVAVIIPLVAIVGIGAFFDHQLVVKYLC
ncbi:hypothetical protein AX16_004114 [Volvariella volvacea WC 439]|nr:hypothetical protein AX16_004114 [Volvariella volvacea WC 439]